MRVGTQHVTPPVATFYTVLVGAVLISGIAFGVNFEEIKTLPLEAYGWITVMGILAYCVARVLHNTAIRMVGAARSVPMISLQPLMAFAIGFLILGERPNLLVTVGTPIIVVGILMVMLPRKQAAGAIEIRKLGYLLAFGGSLAFVTRDAISRHVLGTLALAPPFVVSGFALVIGGAILFAFIHRGVIDSIRHQPMRYVGICCVAGTAAGYRRGLAVPCPQPGSGDHRDADLRQPADHSADPRCSVPAAIGVAQLGAGGGHGAERRRGDHGNLGSDHMRERPSRQASPRKRGNDPVFLAKGEEHLSGGTKCLLA